MFDSKKVLCIIFLFNTWSSLAMVYDYRYMPFIAKSDQLLLLDDKQHSGSVDFFMATASEAVSDEKTINIPSLFGSFDQKKYADGMVKAHYPNFLRPEWRGQSIPWLTPGKIQAQGIALAWYIPLISNLMSTGFNCLFMRLNTYSYFNQENLQMGVNADNKQELDDIRRLMFNTVDLTRNYSSEFGFGDIDWYIRFGRTWHYTLKCRNFNIGGRLGVLIPSGKKRSLDCPTSIPFGGNGHWGMYGAFDGLFELREDLKVGILTRISKRFAKTSCQRLTVNKEPEPLGIVTGPVLINPGFTFIFAPLIALENVREGMGISIQYTMTKHLQDSWCDARNDPSAVPVCFDLVQQLSGWGSDYFTVNVFYDFSKTKVNRSVCPILSLRWDIPAALYVTDNVPSTNRVSMGIECVF